jgi:nitrate/TMAO reductase-like tetraheme cytochrome c subunit
MQSLLHPSLYLQPYVTIILPIVLTCCLKDDNKTSLECLDGHCSIEGVVIDEEGPVSDAVVRIKTTENYTLTDDAGKFVLKTPGMKDPIVITAWAPGYYIGGGTRFEPGETSIEILLKRYSSEDNHDYEWISSYSYEGNPNNCENCHSSPVSSVKLPFNDWVADAHAKTAENIRFLSMYLGTDIAGNQSPLTVYMYHPDYGSVPLLPDLSQPYFGPGYKLDFPNTAGNCATCHSPLAAIDKAYETDPSLLEGIHKEGISCDFCHKILDVNLNPKTGEPHINMPGVLSFVFRRPFENHQFFSGPFDDVTPGEDTYSPVQKKSQYCAPCHYGSFWGIKIYNSFGEWLESPYSDEKTGKTCQDCHMPAGLTDHFALTEAGGLIRNRFAIRSHHMPGAVNSEFLRKSVSMQVHAYMEVDSVKVCIEINNDNTGHHIPTDSPLRHLILLVQAKDDEGNSLMQLNGPTLPNWCGKGDIHAGYYAGLPGITYAKILKEYWTETEPTASYWKQTQIIHDNRIKAFEIAKSNYTFSKPAAGSTLIDIKLIFRRAFIELMDQKGWDTKDIVIAEAKIKI